MRITDIETWQVKMPLAVPYSIAHETIESAANVFIRIGTNKGFNGFGCAAPDLRVTGETIDSVTRVCDEIVKPNLKGTDPVRIALQMSKLKPHLEAQPSAMAMVDMALYDVLGKAAGMPVYKLLGGFRIRMKTSITIGILPVDDTIAKAQEFVKKGFKILKIKGGMSVDADIERVLKVREIVGEKIELRFDANQGYSLEDSLRFVEATRAAKLEILEQPTPKGRLDLLGRITKEVGIPVMADESLTNLRDAFRLAKHHLVDMVNVKLMKVGGISGALQITSVARAANLDVMVGCMDEAALGIAAGLHFALACPSVAY